MQLQIIMVFAFPVAVRFVAGSTKNLSARDTEYLFVFMADSGLGDETISTRDVIRHTGKSL